MKVLWLVNSIMPELAEHLGGAPSVYGGWLSGAMDAVRSAGIGMVICTVSASAPAGKHSLKEAEYIVLRPADEPDLQKQFGQILSEEQPDLIHIFGTEYEAAHAMVSVSDLSRTVVTLQGALQYIWKTCCDGIPEKVLGATALHSLRRRLGMGGQNLRARQRDLRRRAGLEQDILRKIRYADGCSEWGAAFIQGQNPDCRTFRCGCFLRAPFYQEPRWSLKTCTPFTVFALMTRPEKGVHQLIEAMASVVKKHPEAKLLLAGDYFAYRNYSGVKKTIQDLTPDYYWYIQNLIDEYGLRGNISFLGSLHAEQIKQQLLSCSVFVSPASHEHLATALGEARMMGVPSVATAVGAIPEMIDHGRDGYLYHFSEVHVLAQYICDLFENPDLAERFSEEGRAHALQTYSQTLGREQLLRMYKEVLNDNKAEFDRR